jgi:hypothetical protein
MPDTTCSADVAATAVNAPIAVTSCDDCPFREDSLRNADCECQHPGIGLFRIYYAEDGNPPAECPLRAGPITIALAPSDPAAPARPGEE